MNKLRHGRKSIFFVLHVIRGLACKILAKMTEQKENSIKGKAWGALFFLSKDFEYVNRVFHRP